MTHWRSRQAGTGTRYIAALFALDGEYVIDPASASDTIEGVDRFLGNMGSRWYFYPVPVIIRDHPVIHDTARIVNAPVYPDWLAADINGRTLRVAGRIIAGNADALVELWP